MRLEPFRANGGNDVLVRDHHAADLLRSADGETIILVTHAAEEHPEGVLGYMESCFSAFPQAAGFLIEGDVNLGNWDLCGLHARELRFAPDVERIEAGAFSMLVGLERVVIPATVRMVEDCTFREPLRGALPGPAQQGRSRRAVA